MKWLEITVTTAREAAEAVCDILLASRGGGVAEDAAPPGLARLRGYLPAGPAAEASVAAITSSVRALGRFGLDPGPAAVEVREIEDEDWAHAWKAHFKPFAVGRLWITPTWDRSLPPEGAVVVEIDPGMAFGTGLHPSTQMCLDVLDARVRGGERVFDVGTGSGILAIAAAKLGAASVLARDDDPVAVAVARSNAAFNRAADRVTVEEGDLLAGVRDQADAVLANLTADAHLVFLPRARPALRPGGWLAASGIVAPRLTAVDAASREAGFTVLQTLESGEWRCLVLGAG